MDRPSALGRFATVPPGSFGPEMSTTRTSSKPVPAVLAAGAVLAQICYPLLAGEALKTATVMAVLLFAASSVTHASDSFGPIAGGARLLLMAGGIGLTAEAIGVATGVPFGSYRYNGTLGPAVAGVPLLVPLAWTMMAYPCLLLGRRLAAGRRGPGGSTGRRTVTVLTGAATLVGWDFYLDPQMVAAGHWTWTSPRPGLPGMPTVPLTNLAGWLLVSTVMIFALDAGMPARPTARWPGNEVLPASLLAWTWIGSAIGNLAFFSRPAVAGYGAAAMGVCTLPYLAQVFTAATKPRAGDTTLGTP